MSCLFGCKYDYGFWKMFVNFVIRYSGRVKRGASGPSVFSISFRVLVCSSLFCSRVMPVLLCLVGGLFFFLSIDGFFTLFLDVLKVELIEG